MENSSAILLTTPIKSKSVSYFHDSNKDILNTSISAIYSEGSPSNNFKNYLMINTSNEESNTFHSNVTCVTSTPVGRGGAPHQRNSSSFRPKRYSLKSDHSVKRVDINDHVRVFEQNCLNIEKIFNDIHLTFLSLKYCRLNSIFRDFKTIENHIYLYPKLFNADILSSKFVSETNLSSVFLVDHRYDAKSYILKKGDQLNNTLLSPLNMKVIYEIRILKLLGNHPNIVEYCDSWLEEDKMHLQLTYVSGGSLRDFIDLRTHSVLECSETLLSKTATIVLLAHIGSVFAYLHDIVGICHGAVSAEHILIDHIACLGYEGGNEVDEAKCYKALTCDTFDVGLRFKLCNFIDRDITESSCVRVLSEITDIRDVDILSFGMTLCYCLSGIDQGSVYDFNVDNYLKSPVKISEEWNYIIMNLCHENPSYRWTARNIIALDNVNKYILPEARSYLPDYTNIANNSRYLTAELSSSFVKPFHSDNNLNVPLNTGDEYWIKSDFTDEYTNIRDKLDSLANSRRLKDESLKEIHDKHLKIKKLKLHGLCSRSDEKAIYDYPVLFNSDVIMTKFISLTLLSETKLSQIYIANHRYDGENYILKVGLWSPTTCLSDSSREIINEMKILKLIGKHPNVVGYCDCWIEQEKFHLQLKYVAGGSLYDFIQGHTPKATVLSDTTKRRQKYYLSAQSAYVLLAHVASVLVYLHDELHIFHGDIKPSNILVELSGRHLDQYYLDEGKFLCQQILISEHVNRDLRFKLCDFGRSGLSANISLMDEGDGRYLPNLSDRFSDSDDNLRATSRDIFSLGLSIYDCFGGVIDQESARDIRAGDWGEWPEMVSDEWRHIIQNLSHRDARQRWSARRVLSMDSVHPWIVPEARYHMAWTDMYVPGVGQMDHGGDSDSVPVTADGSMHDRCSQAKDTMFFSDDMDASF